MVPAIGWTCAWRVNESVMVALGISCSCGISVNATAVLPYDSNAHARIRLRVFWSTVFSPGDTVPCREIRRRCRGSVECLYLHEPVVVVAADPERHRRRRVVD